MTDEEFFTRLCDCSLPSDQFNHLGHLRLASICLQRFEADEAVRVACDAIRNYATSLGAADKFHWTVAEALMRLLLAARSEAAWPDFVVANGALVADARAQLARHYSPELLASTQARSAFVAPDLAPLPA